MIWPPRSSCNWSTWKKSISLGNDLVWLDDPANQGRFADLLLVRRILSPKERLLVQISENPDRMLWSLWAAKEAAFKAVARRNPETVFSPQRFELNLDPASGEATVGYEALVLPITWAQGPDWVHAWSHPSSTRVVPFVERCPDGQDSSRAVRELALRVLGRSGWGAGRIEGRPPQFFPAVGEPLPISLSHDGPWLAVLVPTRT